MKQINRYSKTKIIGTIGPATGSVDMIEKLIDEGLNIVRLNCSHAGPEALIPLIEMVKTASGSRNRPLSILADLGGPKIRLGVLKENRVLKEGDSVILTTDPDGGGDKIPAGYPQLAEDLNPGDSLLIDDGLVRLEVDTIRGNDITCRAMNDGVLKSRKGINLPGVKVSLSSLTEKDRADLDFLLTQPIDYIALSFVRDARDIRELKEIIRARGRNIPVIAKIEKPEAVENLESIIEATDMVMVARGDLGVEMPTAELPPLQKKIISDCNEANKPVITATQMLDSMIVNPRPTRAEASDVANAVFDGTDAVMLSGETSVGKYPLETVRIMKDIVLAAESHMNQRNSMARRRSSSMTLEHSVCHAACQMAEQNHAAVIICLTVSGRTAANLSKYRSSVPILAFAESQEVIRYLNIFWGVTAEPIHDVGETDYTLHLATDLAVQRGYVEKGDTVVYTAGIPLIGSRFTNMLKVDVIG